MKLPLVDNITTVDEVLDPNFHNNKTWIAVML
jgi:hypothetical protein